MKDILLYALIGFSLGLVAWGIAGRRRLYEFPFLAGAAFSGWLVPQAIGLYDNPMLPEGGYETTIFMGLLCVVATYAGYIWNRKPWRKFDWQLNDRRLLIGAALLSAFGATFMILIRGLPPEMLVGNWTGLPTIYYFFSKTQIYGYALAILAFARTGRPLALALALIDVGFFAEAILIGGRRGIAIEFALTTLLAFWFARRWMMPRAVMIAGLVFATLMIFSIGEYRRMTRGGGHLPTWEQLSKLDLTDTFQDILSEGAHEMKNAVYEISATAATGEYNYGISYWNALVFQYVPAQFVGRDVKDALMFDLPEQLAYGVYGYMGITGMTSTGLTDAFKAFWFFGAGVFFIIARIMSSLYLAALRQHHIAQILYMIMITNALHTVTHTTWWFLTPWLQLGVFLLPVLAWARVKRAPVRRSRQQIMPRSAPLACDTNRNV